MSRLAERRRFLEAEARALGGLRPETAAARQRAGDLLDRGHRALMSAAERKRASLGALADALRALSPAATLERGYAIARLADGTIVRDPKQATIADPLEVVVARGRLTTRVEGLTREGEEPL